MGGGMGGGQAPTMMPTPPPTPSPGEGKVPTTVEDRWVNAHNYWRCLHGSQPLHWDEDFARGAQKWADKGQMSHADCYNIPAPEGPAGENLASGSSMTPEQACEMWHDEDPESGPQCGGHCTAMLWNEGTKLGCGENPNGLHVCRYGGEFGNRPPNFGSTPDYERNVGFPDMSKESACKEKYPVATPHRRRLPPTGWGGG